MNAERDQTMGGRTVLVTGATDGLGRGIARELAAVGARVLLHGRDPSAWPRPKPRFKPPPAPIACARCGPASPRWHDLAAPEQLRELSERLVAGILHAR